MNSKEILINKHQIALDILDSMYPQGFKSEVRKEKSLEDIEWTLYFTIEAIKVNNPIICENYFIWLGEIFETLGFEQSHLELLFQHIKDKIISLHNDDLEKFFDKVDINKEVFNIYLGENNPHLSRMNKYIDFILDGKKKEATYLVQEMIKEGIDITEIYMYIFQESLRVIGSYWQTRKINVAQEHHFTATTQFIMSTLYPYIFTDVSKDKKLIACSIGSELHEVGIRMVADIFEVRGWDTYYLGANVPIQSLLNYIEEYTPDVVALSITMPHHVGVLKDTIDQIKVNDKYKNIKIIVGGLPFLGNDELYKNVGADAYAVDALEGVEVAEKLI